MLKFDETQEILQEYADEIIRLARFNLADPRRPRVSTLTGKTYRKKIDNTGALSESLDTVVRVTANSISMSIKGNEYGDVVDGGRRKGVGIPLPPLVEWVRSPKVQLRGKDGKFIAKTDANVNSFAGFISWKAKHFGIGPTNFLKDAVEVATEKYKGKLPTAILNDTARAVRFIIGNFQEAGKQLRAKI